MVFSSSVVSFVETALVLTTYPARRWVPQDSRLDLWLHRMILRTALRRVYGRFARQHAMWAACLFDEHFLAHGAAPLLAHYIQRASPPTSLDLATAWDEQFGPAEMPVRTRRIAELMPAAADFLNWLEADLRQSSLFDY
jgi:hypothetical protein